MRPRFNKHLSDPKTHPERQCGFTISEILIGVGIVIIIAVLAYPKLSTLFMRKNIENPHRAAAQSEMLVLALAMERDFTITDAYADLIDTGEYEISDAVAPYYDIRVEPENNGGRYTIIATPTQANMNDHCGELRLSSQGQRTAATSDCWR